MVDEERLELGGASAQKLCMIAVCYHNIAVELMVMHQVRPVKQTKRKPRNSMTLT